VTVVGLDLKPHVLSFPGSATERACLSI